MKHVLITGVDGFVGRHLALRLHALGCSVSGITSSSHSSGRLGPILSQKFTCDLSSKKEVQELDLSIYDSIINLAGLSQMGLSFRQPDLYLSINVSILENICSRLMKQQHPARLIAVSSGAVYDNSQPMPLNESSRLDETGSPYARSKLMMEKVALKYRQKGLPECFVTRPFNHIGPGQSGGFILPDLYNKLINARETKMPMLVGDLSTRRDYTDVRDVANAYSLLALSEIHKLKHPIYNVCSGISRSGEEILSKLMSLVPDVSDVEIKIDKTLARPNDPKEQIGSNRLLRQDVAWKPFINIGQTIADYVASRAS